MCSTCGRFAGTHGCVLNLHTGRGVGGVLFSLSFSLPFSLSLFRRSLSPLFLFSPPSLVALSSLSATMTMITRPVGCLCTHGSNLPESQSACTLAHSCLANMFVSCKKQLSWYNCASLVPLGMKWACICAGNGCCVWWCLVV